MKTIFHSDSIEIRDYPFAPATVHKAPFIFAEQIQEVNTKNEPPHIIINRNEVIFLNSTDAAALTAFAAAHQLPDVQRFDIWAAINEPFLEHTPSAEQQMQTIALLQENGMNKMEILDLRDAMKDAMSDWTALNWDCDYLGHYEVLLQRKNTSFWQRVSKDFYWRTMDIALRNWNKKTANTAPATSATIHIKPPPAPPLEKLCKQAIKAAAQAAKCISQYSQNRQQWQVEEKSHNQLVSLVDRTAEQIIVQTLQKAFPEAAFITEENTVAQQEAEWRWVIDPLDGTTNFVHGVPPFSVSIALLHKNEAVIGVVHEVVSGEVFSAWKGGGAFCNGKKINVSARRRLADSLVATGFPYYDYSGSDSYLAVLKHLMRHTRGIRRHGSAAVDLSYVAAGRFDGFFEYSLQAWDVAAGICLVKEAGGKISDFGGGNDYLFGKSIIAANPQILEELKPLIKNAFKNNEK